MNQTIESKNKALVLEAFDTLFNKRDYVAAERYWSPDYIQHSAHIEPGRDGLFNLIKSVPATLKYEPGLIVADGDFVIVHGRFSGHGRPKSWIAADILRVVDGVLVEHWDVLQDEASQTESSSGLPMLGGSFTGPCADRAPRRPTCVRGTRRPGRPFPRRRKDRGRARASCCLQAPSGPRAPGLRPRCCPGGSAAAAASSTAWFRAAARSDPPSGSAGDSCRGCPSAPGSVFGPRSRATEGST